jgi:hypothetical protein
MPTPLEILKKSREELIANHRKDLAELDRVIASLEGKPSPSSMQPGPIQQPPTRSGKYRTFNLVSAIQSYLAERGGGPISVAELAQELIAEGAMVGKRGHPKRVPSTRDIRITISNNGRKKFAYDVHRDTVAIRSEVSEAKAS